MFCFEMKCALEKHSWQANEFKNTFWRNFSSMTEIKPNEMIVFKKTRVIGIVLWLDII